MDTRNEANETRKNATTRDVAAHFGVTERCVQTRMARGEIPFYRIGRAVRFSLREVEQALAARGWFHAAAA